MVPPRSPLGPATVFTRENALPGLVLASSPIAAFMSADRNYILRRFMEHVHLCSYVSTAFLPVWAQACNHNVHKAFVESSESRRCVQTPYLDPLTEKVTKKNRIHRIWGPPDTNGSLLDGQLWAAVARWSKTVRCRPSQPPGWPGTKNWIDKLDRMRHQIR